VVVNGALQGRVYVIVYEEGHLKLGLMRRVLPELDWPMAFRASPKIKVLVARAASLSGVRHVP
jgi:hypothetical protein